MVTSSAISSMRLWDSSIKSRAHVSRSRLRALRHSCYESASLNATNVQTVRAFAQIARNSVYLCAERYGFCRRKICVIYISRRSRFSRSFKPFLWNWLCREISGTFRNASIVSEFLATVNRGASTKVEGASTLFLSRTWQPPKACPTILNQGIRIILNVGHPFSAVLACKDARRLRSMSAFLRLKAFFKRFLLIFL